MHKDNAKSNTQITKNIKGKSVMGEPSKQDAKGKQYFRCHEHSHIASQYPIRNLFVEGEQEYNDEFEEEIYEPIENTSESDEDVRVSNICLSVDRCLYSKR